MKQSQGVIVFQEIINCVKTLKKKIEQKKIDERSGG